MKKFMIMSTMLATTSVYVTPVYANITKCVASYVEPLLNNGIWDTTSGNFLANNRVYTIEHNGATVSNNFKSVPTQNVKILSSKWNSTKNSCGVQVQDANGTVSELTLIPHPKTQR